jgi:N,N'-diacetylchitobiose transport system permease protein
MPARRKEAVAMTTSSDVSASPRRSSNGKRNLKRRPKAPYLLIVPSIIILAVGTGYPTVWQFVTSFKEFGLAQQFGQDAPFVGLDNYTTLLTDGAFWGVIGRSLAFCAAAAAITLVIGLGLALLMQKVTTVARLTLQIALLLAWAMPVVAAMTVWTWLFDRRRGAINYVLDKIPGVDMYRFDWLASPLTFFIVALVIVVWMSVPFVAFSLYAGLTQVPEEVLEAASLDGASGMRRLGLVILPIIKPVVAIVALLQVIWDLRVFTQITMLQDAGASGTSYDLLGTYIYKIGTGAQDFGSASAASILVLLLTITISWWYVRRLLKEDES